MKGSLAGSVLRMHVAAGCRKLRDYPWGMLGMLVAGGGYVHGCSHVRVFDVDVRPMIDELRQVPEAQRAPSLGSDVGSRSFGAPATRIRVCFFLEEQLRHFPLPTTHRDIEGGVAVRIILPCLHVNVGSPFEKHARRGAHPLLGSNVDRGSPGLAELVEGRGAPPRVVKDEAGRLEVPVAHSFVQGVSHVYPSSRLQQPLEHPPFSFARSEPEGLGERAAHRERRRQGLDRAAIVAAGIATATIFGACQQMVKHDAHRLPLVRTGRLVERVAKLGPRGQQLAHDLFFPLARGLLQWKSEKLAPLWRSEGPGEKIENLLARSMKSSSVYWRS